MWWTDFSFHDGNSESVTPVLTLPLGTHVQSYKSPLELCQPESIVLVVPVSTTVVKDKPEDLGKDMSSLSFFVDKKDNLTLLRNAGYVGIFVSMKHLYLFPSASSQGLLLLC